MAAHRRSRPAKAEIADENDQVEEGREEDRVADDREEIALQLVTCRFPLGRSRRSNAC